MPTAITSSNSSFVISSSGFYFMGEDEVLVTSGNGIEGDASNVDLFVNGQIYSDFRAIFFNLANSNSNITIGADATLVAAQVGVAIAADNVAMVNYGDITSLGFIGVNLEFASNGGTSFTNFGNVNGKTSGLSIQGNDQYAVNHGSLTGQSGVRITANDVTFLNHGMVTGSSIVAGAASYGIEVTGGDDNALIENYGTITGATASIFAATSADNAVILNHGTLVGDVVLGNDADVYRSGDAGLVVGQILMNGGNDIVRGGDQADDIDGGSGNDDLHGRGGDDIILGGIGTDTISGGAGADTLDGGADDDLIKGGAGDDILDGNTGEDSLIGGSGDDTLTGGDSNDYLSGGRDDDILEGGVGRDVLEGGKGDDTLNGQNGKDVLNGGAGDDILIGGSGADIFVFDRKAGDDEITDFLFDTDKIDLSAFNLVDFAAFQAANAVTLTSTQIVIDLDLLGGSGSITFSNEGSLFGFLAGDFIL